MWQPMVPLLLITLFLGCTSLDITNISVPVKLTRTYINQSYEQIIDIQTSGMTYYISPNDPSKQKYIYHQIDYALNSSSILLTGIKSDIFNPDFTQNDIINNLPLTVAKVSATDKDQGLPAINGFGNICTNPITNDILTCWVNVTNSSLPNTFPYAYYCSIFYTKTSTFSQIIPISTGQSLAGFNYGVGIICFNDSYFVPYSLNVATQMKVYGVVIDLEGNIKYHEMIKNISYQIENVNPAFSVKGGSKFNLNSNTKDLFTITFKRYEFGTNYTIIEGLFGYYTNLDDARYPIYIYNDSVISNLESRDNYIELTSVVDFGDDCCYIQLYRQSGSRDNLCILLNDIYGNRVDVKQYPNFKDIVVESNVDDSDPKFVDLSMISDEKTHYFAVFYGVYALENGTPIGEGNVTFAKVYSLQRDATGSSYDLMEVGLFETAKLVENENGEIEISDFSIYNLPDTNNIYVSWIQNSRDRCLPKPNGNLCEDVYGQTFEVVNN